MLPGTYKPFSHFEPEKLHSIRDRITEYTFSPGEDIISLGEENTSYYIIKSGSAVVLKKMLEDELEQVEVLGEGDGFGEDALINDTKQSMTVRALEKITVRNISRTDFDLVFRPAFLKEITPEEAEKTGSQDSLFLDVRMEFEYEEEHIPGAINIPLDEVRMRCSELDTSREYYVCCLVGCRSATAAFILASLGFQAKNMKGGILNWTGPLVKDHISPPSSLKPT